MLCLIQALNAAIGVKCHAKPSAKKRFEMQRAQPNPKAGPAGFVGHGLITARCPLLRCFASEKVAA